MFSMGAVMVIVMRPVDPNCAIESDQECSIENLRVRVFRLDDGSYVVGDDNAFVYRIDRVQIVVPCATMR